MSDENKPDETSPEAEELHEFEHLVEHVCAQLCEFEDWTQVYVFFKELSDELGEVFAFRVFMAAQAQKSVYEFMAEQDLQSNPKEGDEEGAKTVRVVINSPGSKPDARLN